MKATYVLVSYKKNDDPRVCHSVIRLHQDGFPFGTVGAWVRDGIWVAGVFAIKEDKIPEVKHANEFAHYPVQLTPDDFTIVPLDQVSP